MATAQPVLRKRPKRRDRRYQWYPVIAVVVILVVWYAYVAISGVRPVKLPSPITVFASFGDLVTEDNLGGHALLTIGRIYGGFAIAAILGIASGMLMHLSRGFRSIADAFIGAFYPLPKIALIPLLIIWMGTGEGYKIVVSTVSAFFPIIVNTYLGVRLVDVGLLKAARDLGLSGSAIQRKIVLPGALPSILAGLQLGLGITVVMVVASEMVGGQNGLGYLLQYAGVLLQTEKVFAILLVLTLLGWLVTQLQRLFDRVVAPWSFGRD
jgi:NitT/TauT family transport system permease protein